MFKYECCFKTNLGLIRRNNEDNFFLNGHIKRAPELTKYDKKDLVYGSGLFAVCDGMGGEEYGERAALIAVESLKYYLNSDFYRLGEQYVEDANSKICKMISDHNGVRSGTTLALLYIKDNNAFSYNIGDSRVYLFRKGELHQLSIDDTHVAHMVKMGILTQEEATIRSDKGVLTQHLGIFADEMIIQAHRSESIAVQDNDIFLLCSDGLTDMLTDTEIALVLNENLNATVLVDALINKAIDNGGRDNITVGIVKHMGKRDNFITKIRRKINGHQLRKEI